MTRKDSTSALPVAALRPEETDESGLGSFKLVKYFSFSSLAVILAFTILLSWLISNNARTVMLRQNEENSRLLSENINQQVFRRFVLPALIRFGDISLRKPEQSEMLDAVINSIIEGLQIESVSIYDSSVNIISYSTDKKQMGRRDMGGEEYYSALAGKSSSRLRYTGSVLSLLHLAGEVKCELTTYTPFHQLVRDGVEGQNIMGVIEIRKDLTTNYAHILHFQGRILLVSVLLMGVLFVVLRSIVSRAGEKLERRAAERQKLKEKLDHAERLAHLGTLIATVSHELKSPLGIVHSTAEMLQKRIRKVAPESEELAAIVVKETERLNSIVVEFLDFARPQDLHFESSDLNLIVRNVLDFLRGEMKRSGISLVTNLDPALPELQLDAEKIYRALLNIGPGSDSPSFMRCLRSTVPKSRLRVSREKVPPLPFRCRSMWPRNQTLHSSGLMGKTVGQREERGCGSRRKKSSSATVWGVKWDRKLSLSAGSPPDRRRHVGRPDCLMMPR